MPTNITEAVKAIIALAVLGAVFVAASEISKKLT